MHQFKRLFKLLEFKEYFVGHGFEIIVDNARTHTAQEYNLFMFGMKPDTRCPVDELRWINENNNQRKFKCYFDQEMNIGVSKGLLRIIQE